MLPLPPKDHFGVYGVGGSKYSIFTHKIQDSLYLFPHNYCEKIIVFNKKHDLLIK
jgi:hypothetical protein